MPQATRSNLSNASNAMNTIQEQLFEICKRHHLDAVYAFGSRALAAKSAVEKALPTADASSASDLDIAVKASPKAHLSLEEKVTMAQELETLFAVSKVDLIDLNQSDPFLAADVIRGERLFCRNEIAADEYELYVLRRAGDSAYLERERMELILNRH